jgi:hypothetical protein
MFFSLRFGVTLCVGRDVSPDPNYTADGYCGTSEEVGLIAVPSIICVNPEKSNFYFGAVALMLKVHGYNWTVSSSS